MKEIFISPDPLCRNFYCYLKYTESGRPKVQNPLLGVTSGFSLKVCDSGSSKNSDILNHYKNNLFILRFAWRVLMTSHCLSVSGTLSVSDVPEHRLPGGRLQRLVHNRP